MMPRNNTNLHTRRYLRSSQSRRVSAIAGAVLLGLAALWLVWLLTHHFGAGSGSFLPLPGFPQPVVQVPSLTAAGVTLAHADQPSALNQQQALIIGSELEPEAAMKAKKVGAQYIVLNYTPTSPSSPHPGIINAPAWLILYQGISMDAGDRSADPTSSTTTSRDLYVFLDANSGKELLVIWV